MHKAQSKIPELLQQAGGLKKGISRKISTQTGVAEAKVYGIGSFYHLLSNPDTKVRVCSGLSCRLSGADQMFQAITDAGLPAEKCSCLAACDMPPAILCDRHVIRGISLDDVEQTKGDWTKLIPENTHKENRWGGHVGAHIDDPEKLAINLQGNPEWSAQAFQKALAQDPKKIIAEIEKSGLQGMGGAAFPVFRKWNALLSQEEKAHCVVLNADEGEPGTFKDRELLMRRPDLVVEGLAIAAHVVETKDIYLYLRGEFSLPRASIEKAIKTFKKQGLFPDLKFHVHSGQGAYICGEETSLLESMEGMRGMPRLKPPFPVEKGLWGKPTLIHNVETIACLPSILWRGGDWFRHLGKTEGGTKLYCLSGHVQRPGTYEYPLGTNLDELAEKAGGYRGTLKAFCPGGASSGFLPATHSGIPLDFKGLAKIGSMLGSAGVIVLNESVDMKWAARQQLRFFEEESCGQCAPCRIGTRYLREAMDLAINGQKEDNKPNLRYAKEVAWQMTEGAIGLVHPLVHLIQLS